MCRIYERGHKEAREKWDGRRAGLWRNNLRHRAPNRIADQSHRLASGGGGALVRLRSKCGRDEVEDRWRNELVPIPEGVGHSVSLARRADRGDGSCADVVCEIKYGV